MTLYRLNGGGAGEFCTPILLMRMRDTAGGNPRAISNTAEPWRIREGRRGEGAALVSTGAEHCTETTDEQEGTVRN